MSAVPRPYLEAMTIIEAMGERAHRLGQIARWPGLTLEERAVHYTIAIIQDRRPLTVDQVAEFLGCDPADIRGAIGRGKPYGEVIQSGERLVQAGPALSYGGAE